MKKLLTLALAVVLLFCMVGCSSADNNYANKSSAPVSLEGTWTGVSMTNSSGNTSKFGAGINCSIVFSSDGTLTMYDTSGNGISGTWTKIDDENISLLIHYIYNFPAKLEGNTITINQSSMPGGIESITYEKQ